MVRCSLVTHSLDAPPDDEALSYTWGDAGDRCALLCNNKVIGGPKNLAQALLRLRHPYQTRVLWADALCINQSDVVEREAQVLLMGDIYRVAQSVAIWLGSSTPRTSVAFRLLSQIHAVVESTPWADRGGILTKAEMVQLGLSDITGLDWMTLGLLFWRPWFTRVWIIQEAALARTAVMYCGADSMPWAQFVSIADFIRQQYQALWVDLDLMPAVQLQQAADLVKAGQPPDLLWLLSTFRDRFATNPVDKVYSLLGLATNHGVVPNYSASVQQTYYEVARKLLASSLDALSLVGDSFWRRTSDLPYWVPDWATFLRMEPYLFRSITHVFHACGSTLPVLQFSTDGNTLSVRGILLDRVSMIGDKHLMALRISYERLEESSLIKSLCSKETRKQFLGWESVVLRLQTYPTGEDIRRVLQQTLLAGANLTALASSGTGINDEYSAFRAYHLSFLGDSEGRAADFPIEASADLATRYNNGIRPAANGRRLFTTTGGYIGLGPMSTKPGDCVVLLCGRRTAYVLRKRRKRGHNTTSYTFVGEAYVHGMMNGEAFVNQHELQDFDLI